MIQFIAEHLVDLELLPPQAQVLDIGCRGFIFSSELQRLGHQVYCVDIDSLDQNNSGKVAVYHQCAISDFDGMCGLARTDDAQGTKINRLGTGIECFTLESYLRFLTVELLDLIKMDVEGSEFEIIMTLTRPPAKQLSIEFHLHTGVYKHHEVDLMVDKLRGLGYSVASHEYTNQHGAGLNYWSSLFILKN